MDRKLAKAFADPDPDAGLRAARALAAQLKHPDAAASLREGVEDMFTVRRLGVGDRLARSLSRTNAIESMISVDLPLRCLAVDRRRVARGQSQPLVRPLGLPCPDRTRS